MRFLISSVSAVALLGLVGASPLLAQQGSNNLDIGACIAQDMSAIDQAKAAIEAAQAKGDKKAVETGYDKLHESIAQLRYDRGICPGAKADK